MPRPKVKEYRVIPLSLSIDVIELLDAMRGEMTRTQFIEMIIRQNKDKIELIKENERLKKRVKELEQEIEDLKAKVEILQMKQKIEEDNKRIEEVYKDLLKVYKNSRDMWSIFGESRLNFAVYDVIEYAKGLDVDKYIIRKALIKLLEDTRNEKYIEYVEKVFRDGGNNA